MIEVFEDRLDEETCITENALLLQSSLASPAALAEADVEPAIGLEHLSSPTDEESKTLDRVRRVRKHSAIAAVHRLGDRLPQVVVHGVVLPTVLLRMARQDLEYLFVGVDRGHLAARAGELHRGAGQIVVTQEHEAALVLARLE